MNTQRPGKPPKRPKTAAAKRPYRMGRRAASQEETRQRIVDATVSLHEEIGLRATTICAIAERAGVQRLTVYRHFPDDKAVFEACTSEWGRRNPPPDPAAWETIEEPGRKIQAALRAFYGYYAGTFRMWSVAYREGPSVPPVQSTLREYGELLDRTAASLAPGRRGSKAHARALATIRHALAFQTWESLRAQGLDEEAMLALVMSWLDIGG